MPQACGTLFKAVFLKAKSSHWSNVDFYFKLIILSSNKIPEFDCFQRRSCGYDIKGEKMAEEARLARKTI